MLGSPLFIVGFMVSGKSTVGRQLATELGLTFIDLDDLIAAERGQSLDEIFSNGGEEAFRELERDTLRRVIAQEGLSVVATGGGTPCHYDNMDRMLARGVVVYLHLSNEEIVTRLSSPRRARRPLLSSLSREEVPEYVRRIMAERSPYYERAHIKVDANHFNINSLALMVEMVDQHRNR